MPPPESALEKDSHGQIIGCTGAQHDDPPETEAYMYAGEAEWPGAMPLEPLSAHECEGMGPAEQLRARGFAHFRGCFTPEFIKRSYKE